MSDELTTEPSASRETCVERAFAFYQEHIIQPVRAKTRLRRQLGFRGDVQLHPGDWELFGALLIGANASSQRYGHDLEAAEIKSAKAGGSFEYQYHKHHGREKLAAEAGIHHVFISYSGNYEAVEVYLLSGRQLEPFWAKWAADLEANYAGDRQRFRRSIPRGEVSSKGKRILGIRGGEIEWADPRPFDQILADG